MNFPLLPIALVAGVAAVEFATINKGWSKSDYKETGLGAGFVANLKTDYFRTNPPSHTALPVHNQCSCSITVMLTF